MTVNISKMSSFFQKLFTKESNYEKQLNLCFFSREQLEDEIRKLQESVQWERSLNETVNRAYDVLKKNEKSLKTENLHLRRNLQIERKSNRLLEAEIKGLKKKLNRAWGRAYRVTRRSIN